MLHRSPHMLDTAITLHYHITSQRHKKAQRAPVKAVWLKSIISKLSPMFSLPSPQICAVSAEL
jgi:hypothetical protein